MKRFKRIAYILLIIIVAVLSVFIYSNASKDNDQTQKEKTYSQIQYMEFKILELSNAMNQIQTQNYSVTAGELAKQSTQQQSGDSGSNQGGDSQGDSQGGSQEEESGGSAQEKSQEGGMGENQQESKQEGSSGSSSSSSGSQTEDKKEFNLEPDGVLVNKEEINWDEVKSEVENLYGTFPTMTIDLYQFDIKQEDILTFNKEYDNLTTAVEAEDKQKTLAQLTKLYEYLPKFLKGSGQEELEITLLESKVNILKAYSKLDDQNWEEISSDINNAVEQYTKLLSNTNVDANKQYSINKGYIILNELKNSVEKKDISVFLIKYKNLLEEINNI